MEEDFHFWKSEPLISKIQFAVICFHNKKDKILADKT